MQKEKERAGTHEVTCFDHATGSYEVKHTGGTTSDGEVRESRIHVVVVDVLPPIACHGGTRGSMFGLRRMLNSMVNARDSRFILVQALDRRSSNDPTSSQRLPFALD